MVVYDDEEFTDMKIKRIYVLFIVLLLCVCAIPFRGVVRRKAVSIIQTVKGKTTVAQRLNEYGNAVRKRLSEDFMKAGVTYPLNGIILVGLKQENLLEVWVSNDGKDYKFLKSYPILAASGTLGAKLAEGDMQVPEGIYEVESLNPNSLYHLALRIAYPNSFDQAKAKLDGRTDLGSDIMIHGKNCSIGCLAMGDEAAEDLFVLVAETGINRTLVVLSPVDFRVHEIPAGVKNLPAWSPELYDNIKAELMKLNK